MPTPQEWNRLITLRRNERLTVREVADRMGWTCSKTQRLLATQDLPKRPRSIGNHNDRKYLKARVGSVSELSPQVAEWLWWRVALHGGQRSVMQCIDDALSLLMPMPRPDLQRPHGQKRKE